MESTEIRPLGLNDIDTLVPLFDGYRQFYRKSSNPEGAARFLTARMNQQEARIFGFFIHSELAGFVLIYPLFSSVRMKPFYLLNDLFVKPEFRNEHIGSALLRYCQELALTEDQAGILLETEKTNVVGNHLYPLMGFESNNDSNFYFWESESMHG